MKARLTYQPPGGEFQSWDIDPDDFDNLEAESLEIVGGETWDSYGQWFFLMARGNMRAIRALLWMLLKRTNPDLDFNEVRFRTNEVDMQDLEDEPVGKDEPDDTDTDSPSVPPASPPDSES
jgi:hypothetical protein